MPSLRHWEMLSLLWIFTDNTRCTCLKINDCTSIVDHFYIALFSALRQTRRSSNPPSLSCSLSLSAFAYHLRKKLLGMHHKHGFPIYAWSTLQIDNHCHHHLSHFLLQLPRQIVFYSGLKWNSPISIFVYVCDITKVKDGSAECIEYETENFLHHLYIRHVSTCCESHIDTNVTMADDLATHLEVR